MACSWRGPTLVLLLVCSVLQFAASAEASANYPQVVQSTFVKGFRGRGLLQAVVPPSSPATPTPTPPTPSVAPPNPAATPPNPAATPPNPAATPPNLGVGPPPGPAPAPIFPPAPPTPVRTYLMWIGIGAFCLVLLSVAVFCLCRKFGEQKIRGAQRLPPLPRYH